MPWVLSLIREQPQRTAGLLQSDDPEIYYYLAFGTPSNTKRLHDLNISIQPPVQNDQHLDPTEYLGSLTQLAQIFQGSGGQLWIRLRLDDYHAEANPA